MTGRSTATAIDEYIAQFPPATQALLQEMRALIKTSAPEAAESISYAIPTFDLNEKHIGFYPTSSGVAVFADELKSYKRAKGSVQLPLDQPLPTDLIRRIVAFRVDQIRKAER